MQRVFPVALQTWGVYEDRLIRAAVYYPEDAIPGRVSFRGDNTDLLTDQRIQKGRFPDVRSTDDRNVATARIISCRHHQVSKAFVQRHSARPVGDFARDPPHGPLSRLLRTPLQMTVDGAHQIQILQCRPAS